MFKRRNDTHTIAYVGDVTSGVNPAAGEINQKTEVRHGDFNKLSPFKLAFKDPNANITTPHTNIPCQVGGWKIILLWTWLILSVQLLILKI